MPLRAFHSRIKLHLIRGASVNKASLSRFILAAEERFMDRYSSRYSKISGFDRSENSTKGCK